LDPKERLLEIQQTRWKHHVNPPKTLASKNWVPVIAPLAAILEEYRTDPHPFGERYKNPRLDSYDRDAMFKFSLEDPGHRTIKPVLKRVGVEFKGWHALRRGLASNLFELGVEDLTVMRILRHASVSVTRQHYIRVRDAKVEEAMEKLTGAVELQVADK
jgi:integrase